MGKEKDKETLAVTEDQITQKLAQLLAAQEQLQVAILKIQGQITLCREFLNGGKEDGNTPSSV